MGEAARDDALVGIESTLFQLRDAASAPSDTPLAVPPRERYQRLSLLGEGGMGLVEQARDNDLLREVAVKLLRPERRRDSRLLEQFLWEARVTAHLDHPNIVPVHDLGVTPDGQLFFTMRLVRGETLEKMLADQATRGAAASAGFNLQRRLRAFLQLCNAVAFAHSRGVLHRDLKPANVMLGEYGEILVTDWGLALPLPTPEGRELGQMLPQNLQTASAGTPPYMSPEQVRGVPLDARSDVYTLGVILYELAALRRAFEGATLAEILTRVAAGDAPRLANVAPGTSSALAAVVERAMALDPAARYPDVKALADEVEIVLDGRTPEAEHASLITQAARFYVAHDPTLADMRVIDFDLWVGAGTFIGAGLALRFASVFGGLWWLSLLVGVLMSIAPTLRWFRLRRGRRGSK